MEGHKAYNDTLDRSRQIAYIYKSGFLNNWVLDSCVICKIKREKTASQLMNKLPLTRVNPISPFQNVFIDLVGPFTINATANSKTQTKVWIFMYLCDISNTLHTEILDFITSKSANDAFRSCSD